MQKRTSAKKREITYAEERGLSEETMRAFRLGYNPKNIYDDPKCWGLEGKKIWLPRGIVISGFNNEQVSYIKIQATHAE